MFRPFLTALFLATVPLAGGAAVLEYQFTATHSFSAVWNGFDETADYDANILQAAGTISGTVRFDDTFVSSTGGTSFYGPTGITIDGYTFKNDISRPNVTALVDNATTDAIITGGPGFNPSDPNGIYTQIGVYLVDDSNTLFSGGVSFPDLIDPADFSQFNLSVRTTVFDASIPVLDIPTKQARFEITDWKTVSEPAPVPLPAGVPLILGGFAMLGLIARRRTR